jgi:hypothetical protein
MSKIAIVYGAGCYGTFVNWCLKYFSDPDFDIGLPLTSTGSAHDFPNQMISQISPFPFSSLSEYLSNPDSHQDIIRMHWVGLLGWKDLCTESVTDRINLLEQSFDKIIFLMPTEETLLWIADNKFSKLTTRKNHCEHFIASPEVLKNLENWPVTDLDNIEPWILREWLSLHYYNASISECGMNAISEFKRIGKIVTCEDLRDHFNETIKQCIEYIGKEIIREDELDSVYKSWIEKQYFINSIDLVKSIVSHTIGDVDLSWDTLTFTQEVWIQMMLREKGYEIRCHGLNEFPTNSKQLRELIYATR